MGYKLVDPNDSSLYCNLCRSCKGYEFCKRLKAGRDNFSCEQYERDFSQEVEKISSEEQHEEQQEKEQQAIMDDRKIAVAIAEQEGKKRMEQYQK